MSISLYDQLISNAQKKEMAQKAVARRDADIIFDSTQEFEDPTLGETFTAGAKATVQGLGADLEYFKAIGNSIIGDDEAVRKNIKEAEFRSGFAANKLADLQTFEQFWDEPTFDGFVRQVAKGTGQLLPYAVTSIAGAFTGGALGAVVPAAVSGLRGASQIGAKKIITDALQAASKGIATKDQKQIAQSVYERTRAFLRDPDRFEKAGTKIDDTLVELKKQATDKQNREAFQSSVEETAKKLREGGKRGLEVARAELAASAPRAKKGAIAGAFSAEYVPLSGQNVSEAIESGLDINDPLVAFRSAAVAVPQAGLGVLGEIGLVKLIGRTAKADSLGRSDSVMGRLAGDLFKGSLKGGSIESVTEVAQEGIGVLNRFEMDENYTQREANLRLGEAAFAAFFGGGAFGGAGSTFGGAVRESTSPETVAAVKEKVGQFADAVTESRTYQKIYDETFGRFRRSRTDLTTAQEPQADINAQEKAMLNPASGKRAMWVSSPEPAYEADATGNKKPKKIEIGEGDNKVVAYSGFVAGKGTIVALDPELVQKVLDENASEDILGRVLYNREGGLPSDGDAIMEVRDEDGNLVSGEQFNLATEEDAARTRAEAIAEGVPNSTVTPVTTQEHAADRVRRLADEEPQVSAFDEEKLDQITPYDPIGEARRASESSTKFDLGQFATEFRSSRAYELFTEEEKRRFDQTVNTLLRQGTVTTSTQMELQDLTIDADFSTDEGLSNYVNSLSDIAEQAVMREDIEQFYQDIEYDDQGQPVFGRDALDPSEVESAPGLREIELDVAPVKTKLGEDYRAVTSQPADGTPRKRDLDRIRAEVKDLYLDSTYLNDMDFEIPKYGAMSYYLLERLKNLRLKGSDVIVNFEGKAVKEVQSVAIAPDFSGVGNSVSLSDGTTTITIPDLNNYVKGRIITQAKKDSSKGKLIAPVTDLASLVAGLKRMPGYSDLAFEITAGTNALTLTYKTEGQVSDSYLLRDEVDRVGDVITTGFSGKSGKVTTTTKKNFYKITEVKAVRDDDLITHFNSKGRQVDSTIPEFLAIEVAKATNPRSKYTKTSTAYITDPDGVRKQVNLVGLTFSGRRLLESIEGENFSEVGITSQGRGFAEMINTLIESGYVLEFDTSINTRIPLKYSSDGRVIFGKQKEAYSKGIKQKIDAKIVEKAKENTTVGKDGNYPPLTPFTRGMVASLLTHSIAYKNWFKTANVRQKKEQQRFDSKTGTTRKVTFYNWVAAVGATPEPPVPESIQGVYGLVVGKDAQKDITIQDLFKDGMRSIDEVHNDSTFYVLDSSGLERKYLKFNKQDVVQFLEEEFHNQNTNIFTRKFLNENKNAPSDILLEAIADEGLIQQNVVVGFKKNGNKEFELRPLDAKSFFSKRGVGFEDRPMSYRDNEADGVPDDRDEELADQRFNAPSSSYSVTEASRNQQGGRGKTPKILNGKNVSFPFGNTLAPLVSRSLTIVMKKLKLKKPVGVFTISQLDGLTFGQIAEKFGDRRVAQELFNRAKELKDNSARRGLSITFSDAHFIILDDTKSNDPNLQYDTALVGLHELGHALFRETMDDLASSNRSLRRRVEAAYQNALKGDDVPAAWKGKNGFEEWFADDFTKWANGIYVSSKERVLQVQSRTVGEKRKQTAQKAKQRRAERRTGRSSQKEQSETKNYWLSYKKRVPDKNVVNATTLEPVVVSYKTAAKRNAAIAKLRQQIRDENNTQVDEDTEIETFEDGPRYSFKRDGKVYQGGEGRLGRQAKARNFLESKYRELLDRLTEAFKALNRTFQRRFGGPASPEFVNFIDAVIQANRVNNFGQDAAAVATYKKKAIVRALEEETKQFTGFTRLGQNLENWISAAYNSPRLDPIKQFLFTANYNLRRLSPAIADMFQYEPGKSEGQIGFLKAAEIQNRVLREKFIKEVGSFNDEAVQVAVAEAATDTPTAELSELGQKVRTYLESVYNDYIQETGQTNEPVGFQENFFPVVLDMITIANDPDAFVDLIVQNEMEVDNIDPASDAATELRARVRKAVAQVLTKSVESGLIEEIDPRFYDQDYYAELQSTATEDKLELFGKAAVRRLTAKIGRDQLTEAGFVVDPMNALLTYNRQMVKRIEWRKATGKINLSQELNKLKESDREFAESVINSYLGHGYPPLSPLFQGIQSTALATFYTLLLPFATIGSLPELAGPVVRSREFGGFEMWFRQWKEGLDQKEATQIAKEIGLIESEAVTTAYMSIADQQYLSPKAKQWTDLFFKVTLLDWFTNFTRSFATGMAIQFLNHHATATGNTRSARYLSELNVTPQQIQAWEASGRNFSTPEGKAVAQAIRIFHEESILRPNATERPLWANDPRYQLFWQLKGYFYAFYTTIVKGITGEIAARQSDPEAPKQRINIPPSVAMAAIPAIALLPLAMAGMELREYAKTGLAALTPFGDDENYFRTDTMSWGEYISEAIEKTGIYGGLSILFMAKEREEWNGLAAGAATLAGPAFEATERFIRRGDIGQAYL